MYWIKSTNNTKTYSVFILVLLEHSMNCKLKISKYSFMMWKQHYMNNTNKYPNKVLKRWIHLRTHQIHVKSLIHPNLKMHNHLISNSNYVNDVKSTVTYVTQSFDLTLEKRVYMYMNVTMLLLQHLKVPTKSNQRNPLTPYVFVTFLGMLPIVTTNKPGKPIRASQRRVKHYMLFVLDM